MTDTPRPFTDEQIERIIAQRLGNPESMIVLPGELEIYRSVLDAAIAQGVVVLPPEKVEDAEIRLHVDRLRAMQQATGGWGGWGNTADLLERLAAERKPIVYVGRDAELPCSACGHEHYVTRSYNDGTCSWVIDGVRCGCPQRNVLQPPPPDHAALIAEAEAYAANWCRDGHNQGQRLLLALVAALKSETEGEKA